MNPNEMTQKTVEALQSAIELAAANSNPTLEPIHLLQALSAQPDTAFTGLLKSIEANSIADDLSSKIDKLPTSQDLINKGAYC